MQTERTIRLISLAFCLITFFFAVIVMVAWKVGAYSIVQVIPHAAPMQFNTALGIALAAAGIVSILYLGRGWRIALGGVLLLGALATFLQYVLDINFHLDELFHIHQLTDHTSHPGRMAPSTAVGLILFGLATCITGLIKSNAKFWLPACLAAIGTSFGVVAILGYIAGFSEAYGWRDLTDMSLSTAIAFTLLSAALFGSSLTYSLKGKVAPWVITPLMIFSYTTAMLLWRAIEVSRVRSLLTESPSIIGPFISISLVIALVFALYLQKKCIDITDALERAKLASEINSRMKTHILRYLSHEIRNPLNAVIGFSEPFVDHSELIPEAREAMDCIYSASMHIKNIVDDLLAVSRFDSGKIQLDTHDYQVRPWAEHFARPLKRRAENQNILFEVQIDDSVPEVLKGDSVKLSQIIINLTENAFKYTPQQGNVTVSIRVETGPTGAQWLHVEVIDTGRGIPIEAQRELFEPFFQVHQSDSKIGLGLGLSICKKYIDMMGGMIEVTSEKGKGTRFHFSVEAFI